VHVLLVNEPTSTHDWEDVIRPCIWMMIRSGVALQYATWTLVRQVLKCDRGGICRTSVVALQYVSHYSTCTAELRFPQSKGVEKAYYYPVRENWVANNYNWRKSFNISELYQSSLPNGITWFCAWVDSENL
jgi:hypothetical protein